MIRKIFLTFFTALVGVHAQNLVIRNVTVIDGTGAAPLAHTSVLIRGERIVKIGPTVSAAGAEVVDGTGKYLIPGLWDMHVHLWEDRSMFGLYIANGVTGIRDMGSDFARTSKWRKEALAGRTIGPRIYTPGSPVDGPQPQPGKLKPIRVATPEAARNAADTLDIQEVDFIKVLSTLSRDAYLSLAQRARLLRVPFAGHVPESVSVLEAIEERQRSMEHMFGLLIACSPEESELRDQRAEAIRKQDGAALRKLRERTLETFSEVRAVEIFRRFARFGVWQTPTLTLRQRLALIGLDGLVTDPRLKHIPADILKSWDDPREDLKLASPESLDDARRDFEKHLQLVGMMKRNGVDLLAGTDTGDPYVLPGFALHDELALMVRAGLTPMEALQTATRNPARFFGIEATTGTIQTGKIADLVLLRANPVADIHNTTKIEAVVLRGKLLTRSKLDDLLKP